VEERRRKRPRHNAKSTACAIPWGRHSACQGLFQQPARVNGIVPTRNRV
jgi:hypothetical protein